MVKKLSVIAMILMLALAIFVSGCQSDSNSDNTEPPETQGDVKKELGTGDLAPDFKLKDMADEELELSSLRGDKAALIVFWASG